MNPSEYENQEQKLDEKLQLEKENLEADMADIPDLVRQRLDAFYAQMESDSDLLPDHSSSHRPVKRFLRRTAITAVSAALIGVMIIGSAYVSPTMAESLKQVPLVDSVFKLAGDLGLQTADQKGLATSSNLSVTHDGITLEVPQIIFDGTRLVVALEKSGGDSQHEPLYPTTNTQGQEEDIVEKIDLFINGTSVDSNSSAFNLMYGRPGKDNNSMLIAYMRDPASGKAALPDQFELEVYAKLKGVSEPFRIQTTVHKTKINSKILQPQMSKSNPYLAFTVEKLEMTPITTKITTSFKMLTDIAHMPDEYTVEREYNNMKNGHTNQYTKKELDILDYAVFDEQGRELQLLSGSGVPHTKERDSKMITLFTPFVDTPQKIIFKPYILPTQSGGSALLDAKGNWTRHYIDELEITIDVPQNTNHP
ncbi:DUF4179 domain-containing protein [Paenibacillus polymyxa]|uniref:DUF4179 domain-containing protein n=1 Tax=Paenibacillus polymyxa TaxID=1406 RepID=UPI0025B66228|nr:DUF4179 domain-containing protein [Paenibacillus polymyxa]MDN4080406.1 DUF4179 domain-containing protein [Paenibacillus polymyxa]MDN4105683.1 DUF4179 domain-containing protein [Paenibacillus polymyxa]MDN4115902.1 DUF4179 domain-containing protein [Paenibacillus polymyxa]